MYRNAVLHFFKNLENLILNHKVEHIIFQLQEGNKNVVRHFLSSPDAKQKATLNHKVEHNNFSFSGDDRN